MDVKTGRDFYRTLASAADGDRIAQDYQGLDQGVIGTKLRHEQVTQRLGRRIRGGTLLDLGCGTGLLLDHLADMRCLPRRYLGVDFLDRKVPVLHRAAPFQGLDAAFEQNEIQTVLAALKPDVFDAAVAVGVLGVPPFASIHALARLLEGMQRVARRGLLTAPRPYTGHLGEATQAHFDPDDVAIVLAALGLTQWEMALHSPRELSLWW